MTPKKINVVVTGVGAIIGQGIVNSLKACKYNLSIIGIDRNPETIGAYFCDKYIPKPECDEESAEYLAFWKNLIVDENIDIILPGLELDVDYFDDYRYEFSRLCVVALNSSDLISLSRDKWALHLDMQKKNFHVIPSLLSESWSECRDFFDGKPFLIKPKTGNGSRGIQTIIDRRDFEYWLEKSECEVFNQKIIGTNDEEYTVGAFGLGKGKIIQPIIFRRLLSPLGYTQFAEVVDNQNVRDFTYELCEEYLPVGPTNFQFRVHNDKPYLLEINPRLSSSNSLRTKFGFNESAMALKYYFLQKELNHPKLSKGKGWRYSEDYVQK